MILTNAQTGKTFRIGEKTLMGRERDCQVVLSDKMASRRHAGIFLRDGRHFLEDLGSRNGTLLNQRPVQEATLLREGDVIQIGETSFIVGADAVADAAELTLSADDWSAGGALTYETLSPLTHDITQDISDYGLRKSDADLCHRLSLFVEISNAIRRLRHTDDLEHEIVRRVREAFSIAKRCLIVMKDESSGELVIRAYDRDPADSAAGVGVSRTILENVLDSGNAIMSANPREGDTMVRSDSAEKYHIHSFLCAPLAVSGVNHGVIFLDALDEKSRFAKDDLSLLTLIANEISLALENAGMFDRICRERNSLALENVSLREETQRYDFDAIIGSSPALTQVIEAARRASHVDSTVLITGKSGTGKELVARAIHYNGARGDQPFFSLNCAAIARDLVESELFGHEKGAFTGALERKAGIFETANGGSILLDEIADMPLDVQAKLLKVLEDKEIRRIGGREMIPVDVRLMAATNKDLDEEVREGRFREDLFYRLNVVRINVPPLCDHKEDILPIANHYLGIFSPQMHKAIAGFSPAAIEALQRYGWPGNVRELKNIIERVVLEIGERSVIDAEDLPAEIREPGLAPRRRKRTGRLRDVVEEVEKDMIRAALEQTQGNKSEAARLLGLSREGLSKKLKRYGFESS